MAIELTTASDSQKKLIRDSLRALGVSGNNTFILNGDILATRSITITGNLPFGDSPALQIPNGRIKLGYMPDYGDLNDGTYLYNDRVGNDYIEFRIETVDNGGEPIVLRQNDSIGGNLYENIVVGQDHKVGINVPTGLRSFPSTLSVFGNISASGSLFVQSIVQDSSNPLVVDVNLNQPAIRVTQRGSGTALTITGNISAQNSKISFGLNSLASGTNSFAQGEESIASGINSHAQNNKTRAIGDNSTAVGLATRARGNTSHSSGAFAEAVHDRAWVWAGTNSFDLNTPHVSSTRADQFLVSARGGVFFPGSVGIGTDSIARALTVVGDISATGTIFGTGIGGSGREDVNTAVITNSANWNTSFSRVSANDVVYSNPVRETSSTGMSAVGNIVAMTQTGYDTLAVKLSSTLYIIV